MESQQARRQHFHPERQLFALGKIEQKKKQRQGQSRGRGFGGAGGEERQETDGEDRQERRQVPPAAPAQAVEEQAEPQGRQNRGKESGLRPEVEEDPRPAEIAEQNGVQGKKGRVSRPSFQRDAGEFGAVPVGEHAARAVLKFKRVDRNYQKENQRSRGRGAQKLFRDKIQRFLFQ